MYSKAELDSLTREMQATLAAALARCPIAVALREELDAEADALLKRGLVRDPRWTLLNKASCACTEAILLGRDLRHDGPEDALDVAQVMRFAREAA